jgi:hypothetical protein
MKKINSFNRRIYQLRTQLPVRQAFLIIGGLLHNVAERFILLDG